MAPKIQGTVLNILLNASYFYVEEPVFPSIKCMKQQDVKI